MNAVRLLALMASTLCFLASASPVVADQTKVLQGEINDVGAAAPPTDASKPIEPMPVPVLNPPGKPISGEADKSSLKGNAADSDNGDLNGMTPKSDQPNVLKGGARVEDSGLAGEDPDVDDQELMVQWDKWRNRLLYAIQSGVQETLNNPDDTMLRWDPRRQAVVMRFPLGTTAWFSCQVTNDKHIVNLKLMHSSGFPNFDEAVIRAVKDLEGSSILRYPSRSHRQIVSQVAGIKTSESSEPQYFHFGDVEKYRTPVNQ